MSLALALVAVLFQSPTPTELRAALNALKDGHPGEVQFEAALPRLPDLLASGSAAFVQGGAYLAGVHKRTECAPALVAALERENVRAPEMTRDVTRSILDALIRLDLAAPQEVLLARPDSELASEVYLALACEKDAAKRADGFAKFVERGWIATDAHWAALCRLTAVDDPRAAQWLVAGAPWEFEWVVRDPGSSTDFGGRFGGGRWSVSHPLWPPRVNYSLVLPDAERALDGIEFKRVENTRSGPSPSRVFPAQRSDWRERLLANFVGAATHLGADDVRGYTTSTDLASLERELASQVASLRTRIRAAADALAARKLVDDASVLCAQLKFRAELVDLRDDRTKPIDWPASTTTIECSVVGL